MSIALTCCQMLGAAATDVHGTSITLLVCNRASLSTATIANMRVETDFILGKAGISIAWIDCSLSEDTAQPAPNCQPPFGGSRFLLRVTREHVRHRGAALGFAYVDVDGGSYATLLMDRIENTARDASLSPGQVLGHSVAHEIGHLLMGSNSHCSRGLMRAEWTGIELHEMQQRRLLFSKREAERMRANIGAWLRAKVR